MALTKILTESDGSAGRDKVAYDAVVDLDHEIDPIEWNNIKKAVAEITAGLGLGDGTTADSLTALLTAKGKTWRQYDDFDGTSGIVWTTSGTGAAAFRIAQFAGEGHGLLRLTGTSGQNYQYLASDLIGAEESPIFRGRVRGVGSTTRVRLGLEGDTTSSYVLAVGTVGTGWELQVGSAAGASTSAGSSVGTFADGEWYDVRLELDAVLNQVRLYVDDVLLDTETAVAAIPHDTDQLGMKIRGEGNGGNLQADFDFAEARGVRL